MALIWPTRPPYADEGQNCKTPALQRFDIQVRNPSWWGWETMRDQKEDRPYT